MGNAQLYQHLRGRLYRRLPMLALPLGLLDWCVGNAPGTDGRAFFAPALFLEQARTDAAADDVLLHSVLHAMLGHPWLRAPQDAEAWALACDLCAEFLRCRLLNLPLEGALGRAYYALAPETVSSAPAIWKQLTPDFPVPRKALIACTRRDSHTYWHAAQQRALAGQTGGTDGNSEAERAALWRRQGAALRPYSQPEKPKIGAGTTGQRLALPELPDNHARFAALLREFSVLHENRHVSDVDFSYAWYAYGLEHYGGVPLIEPLEYSEERKLRELVIVLDTSASCSRGMTAWFLSAVRTILLEEHLFFERFRLHILQCDCAVQQDTLVTNLEEFQWYLAHLELYGGGGTDFRPAFRHIDELVARGELARLGGVLYFTDGYGVFPERAPDYPVAFVMLQYRYDDINIPHWARTLVLDAEKPGRDEAWI